MAHHRTLTPEERAQRERFVAAYARSSAPVMHAIGSRVCGCRDYFGTSWTTVDEADDVVARLRLRPGMRLLDLGAGAGWPGLYMARVSGCGAVLVDLPEIGLRIARDQAKRDGSAARVAVVVADAADLPFPDGAFDAVAHSDLLCCLRRKRETLAACRRLVGPKGRMVFTVISVAGGLSPAAYRRAVANGPDFVESEADYPTLLAETGWTLAATRDLTGNYAATCQRQLEADLEEGDRLGALLGADAMRDRLEGWRSKIAALAEGLLRRELFDVVPTPQNPERP